MRRLADASTLEAATLGGTLLSAGAGGEEWLASARADGMVALAAGEVEIIDLDELADDDLIITVAAVGAPSTNRSRVRPEDRIEAVRALLADIGDGVRAIMISEATTVNGWLQGATLGLPVVDAAGDGRGHPTVEMGSLGLNDRLTVQTAVAGGDRPLRVVTHGSLADTSQVLRQAAVQVGGLIACARLPLPAGIVRERAAIGAVSYQIRLGELMRQGDPTRIGEFVAVRTGGAVLATGEVRSNSVSLRGSFDIGEVVVASAEGDLRLPVVNEYMAAWRNDRRLALFPDLLATLSPATGLPVALKDLRPGSPVVVLHVPKEHFPVGAGARDEGNLKEVETMSGLVMR